MAVLRPLAYDDLDDLVALQQDGAVQGLAHMFPQDTHPFPFGRIRARWSAELADPQVHCFVIVSDEVLAGFAATRGDEFLHFGTAVSTWGTGLAGQAHDEVLEHLRAQGYRRARLRVFDENARAVRFYTRRGWTPTDATSQTSFPPHPTLRSYEIDLT